MNIHTYKSKQSARVNTLVLLGLLIAGSVQAISYGGIGGRPANPDPNVKNSESWFIYNLDGGEQKEDAVIILNPQEQEERVIVYAADSIASTDGGFGLRQRTEEKVGVGSWITFYPGERPTTTEAIGDVFYDGNEDADSSILTLCTVVEQVPEDSRGNLVEYYEAKLEGPISENGAAFLNRVSEYCTGTDEYEFQLPGQTEFLLPFIISIPEDTSVGEHSGGILVQKVETEETEEGETGIKLTTRLGVRVYETVPGEVVRNISLVDFSSFYQEEKGTYTISLSARNEGNVSQDVDLTFNFSNLLFGIHSEEVKRGGKIAPNDAIVSNLEWQPPKFGWFKVSASVSYDNEGEEVLLSTDTLTIVIVPWTEIGFIGLTLVIILLFIGRMALKSRKMRDTTGWKSYTVKKGDTITDLADERKIHWKRIAVVNKLKSPYALKSGRKILLPSKKSTAAKKIKRV